jgi:hypothetical protein
MYFNFAPFLEKNHEFHKGIRIHVSLMQKWTTGIGEPPIALFIELINRHWKW